MENTGEAEKRSSVVFSKGVINVVFLKALFVYISMDCNMLEISKQSVVESMYPVKCIEAIAKLDSM